MVSILPQDKDTANDMCIKILSPLFMIYQKFMKCAGKINAVLFYWTIHGHFHSASNHIMWNSACSIIWKDSIYQAFCKTYINSAVQVICTVILIFHKKSVTFKYLYLSLPLISIKSWIVLLSSYIHLSIISYKNCSINTKSFTKAVYLINDTRRG